MRAGLAEIRDTFEIDIGLSVAGVYLNKIIHSIE